ncbi:MAG: GDP-mannose 4,6-dehydratase [Butyrivibrio sp.]|uniref:NAD-dependent epimerase/dehydratase family protein n=1 Tax=Butyrivibrio sp. TaxID=28121 RepID=UPI001B2F1D3E|nr:NAD-dependent epimerase/dehydratase family protein [Butyrivibrio sp.]MBO6242297.1 GDP-mannose 4,6-dehydratase [Butyrivibrio sp.]
MLEKNIALNGKRILVTGAAGFIGANLCKELLRSYRDIHIYGIDNMNDYYDPKIKNDRLREIYELACSEDESGSTDKMSKDVVTDTGKFDFVRGSIADKELVNSVFEEFKPEVVVNLAAQAGVRYSIENPDAYIESNIIGFYNILEACRHSYDGYRKVSDDQSPINETDDNYAGVQHLVYASSSSVYGSNKKIPYSVEDKVDNPVSLYAATKKSNELLAHSYSKLYGIPSTGLRFFTVYGPAGRPDMAYFGFTNKLVNGDKIKIFNYGNCKRDFTFIDDIVKGVVNVMQVAPSENENGVKYRIYNIGNNDPINLLDFVDILQQELIGAGVLPKDYDFESHKELVPMQPGDVEITYADVTALQNDFGFKPETPLRDGLRSFAKWYKDYYC